MLYTASFSERWPSGRRRSPAKGVWGLEPHRGFESLSLRHCSFKLYSYAPVAQLDRVPGYELGGREFESLRARHITKSSLVTLLTTAGLTSIYYVIVLLISCVAFLITPFSVVYKFSARRRYNICVS